MKRYLRLSIIRKLPLFVVLSVLLLTVAFVSASNVEFESYYAYYEYSPLPNCDVAGLISTFFLVMMALPFFSMNYRYSIGKSDLYRQVAFKDKRIRWGEHLSSLIIVCIAFTIAISVQVCTLLVKNCIVAKHPYFYLNYIWFIPMYFTCLVVGAGLYFISYLLISRSNVFINSLLVLCMGFLFINFLTYIPVYYATADSSISTYFADGPTVVGAISYTSRTFNELICYNKFYMKVGETYWEYQIAAFVICIVEFISLVTLSIIAFVLEKDPSSEWAGKPDSNKPYQEIIFHAGFAAIGLLIGVLMSGSLFTTIMSLLFYVIYAVCYYTLYGLLHRIFKLKGYQYAIIFGIVGFSIVASIVYLFAHVSTIH